MEFNKLVASVLVAGLVFMVINVGVDEILGENDLEATVYPVPAMAASSTETMAEEAVPSVLTLLATADLAAGKKLLKRCASCHDMSQGGPNKVGPNLWGVVGADIASHDGYSYSGALSGIDGNWSYEKLDAFLTKPKAFAKGTKMTFAGLKKPADRANVIGFLRMLNENPIALPAE